MRRSRGKLEEAKFFLDKVEEHYYDALEQVLGRAPARKDFHYYLSAFVSAARSITWVMRSECCHIPGWQEWFHARKATESEQLLLRQFNDLRVRSEKVEPLTPGHVIEFEDTDGTPRNARDPRMPSFRMSIGAIREDGQVGEMLFEGEVRAFQWTMDEFDGEDLLSVARRYLALLEKLVAECESRFHLPAI